MLCANRTVWASGLALVVGAGLCLSIGCGGGADYEGSERAAVSGAITFDGNPVVYGTVTFVPAGEGKRASGMIRDGSYSIPEEQGPNLGQYKVQISGYEKAPETSVVVIGEDGEEESEDIEDEEGEGQSALGQQVIPAKYNAQTTLEVEIGGGDNTHDFPLTSGG